MQNATVWRALLGVEEAVVEDVSIPLETISIKIDSKPSEPTVFWNGEIRFERPLVVPKGENEAEVRLKSPGFQETTITVVPDKDQTISVTLKKLRRRRKSR